MVKHAGEVELEVVCKIGFKIWYCDGFRRGGGKVVPWLGIQISSTWDLRLSIVTNC
jgi:hypothetical protein